MEGEQTKKLAVLGVLLVVLAAVWYVVLFGLPGGGAEGNPKSNQKTTAEKKKKKKAKKGADKDDQAENGDKDELGIEEIITIIKSVESGMKAQATAEMTAQRNPFVFQYRPKPPEINLPDLRVTVILSSSGKGTAVINGKAVSEGEKIGPDGNVTVTEIASDSVKVTYSAKGREIQKTLTLE